MYVLVRKAENRKGGLQYIMLERGSVSVRTPSDPVPSSFLPNSFRAAWHMHPNGARHIGTPAERVTDHGDLALQALLERYFGLTRGTPARAFCDVQDGGI